MSKRDTMRNNRALSGLDLSGVLSGQVKLDDLEVAQNGLLVKSEEGWHYGRVLIGRTGIVAPNDLSLEEYRELGSFLMDVSTRIQWLLGDWLAFGENRQWGETYQSVAEEFGYSYGTLRNFAWVCGAIDLSRRRDKLSFKHHVEIAKLEPERQDYWLDRAEAETWSSSQLRKAIKDIHPLTLSDGVSTRSDSLLLGSSWRSRWDKLTNEDRYKEIEFLRNALTEMETGLDLG